MKAEDDTEEGHTPGINTTTPLSDGFKNKPELDSELPTLTVLFSNNLEPASLCAKDDLRSLMFQVMALKPDSRVSVCYYIISSASRMLYGQN